MKVVSSNQKWEQDAQIGKVRQGGVVKQRTEKGQCSSNVCFQCNQVVKNINKHVTRIHSDKFWGYQCHFCCHCESRLDNSFFRKHISNVHDIDVSNQDLESFKVDVPQGYKVPMKCPLCFFQCFEDQDMKVHFSNVHPVVKNEVVETVSVKETDMTEEIINELLGVGESTDCTLSIDDELDLLSD